MEDINATKEQYEYCGGPLTLEPFWTDGDELWPYCEACASKETARSARFEIATGLAVCPIAVIEIARGRYVVAIIGFTMVSLGLLSLWLGTQKA